MQRKNLVIIISLALILALAGCPMEGGDALACSGRVVLDFTDGPTTRSIVPDIPTATAYDIEFTRLDDGPGEAPAPQLKVSPKGPIVYNHVHVGTYTVKITGYAGDIRVMEGTSPEFTVAANKDTAVTVQLELLGTGGKGKLSVTFDWTAVKGDDGPLNDAVTAGSLQVKIVDNDATGNAEWPEAITKPVVPGADSLTFEFDMPVRKEAWNVTVALADQDGNVFYSVPTQALIRENVTSVPDKNQNDFTFTTDNLPSRAQGAMILRKALSHEAPETTVVITARTAAGADGISFRIYDITDGSRTFVSDTAFMPIVKDMEYSVSGLSVGKTFAIETNVRYADGATSGWRKDAKLESVTTLKPVKAVTLSFPADFPQVIDTNHAPFEVKAVLDPVDATVQTVNWNWGTVFRNTVEGETHALTVTLAPAIPGKQVITVVSQDRFSGSPSVTSQEFTVKLASPTDVHASIPETGLGIVLTWNAGDTFADKYVIERKEDAGEYSVLTTVEAPKSRTGALTYTDENLVGGTKYTYRVTAKSTLYSDPALDSAASPESEQVTAVRLKAATGVSAAMQEGVKAVKVTWTAGDKFADTYTVTRNDGKSWEVSGATEYMDTEIVGGQSYTYTVAAKSTRYPGAGFDAPVSEASAPLLMKLAAPTGLTAAPAADGLSIELSWTTGDAFADSWLITRNDGNSWTSDTASYKDVDIAGGKTYTYTVTAKSSVYGEGFDSDATAPAEVVLTNTNTTITVTAPKNGESIALTGTQKTITKTSPLTLEIAGGIKGATAYEWTVDGMVIPGFTGNTVTVTYDDTVNANPGNPTKRDHVLAVRTDIGVSATYRFRTEFFELGTSAPSLRLPTTFADEIWLWTESSTEKPATIAVKSETKDGASAPAGSVAEVSADGLLTIKGYGTVVVETTDTDKKTAELTFDFYEPSFRDAKKALSTVNGQISTVLKTIDNDKKFDWWTESASSPKFFDNSVTVETANGGVDANAEYGMVKFSNHSFVADGKTYTIAKGKTEGFDYIPYNKGGAGETGRWGTDNLNWIARKNTATLTVELPGNQGTATITLKNINIWPKDPAADTLYTITFSDDIGTYDGAAYSIEKGHTYEFDSAKLTEAEKINCYR